MNDKMFSLAVIAIVFAAGFLAASVIYNLPVNQATRTDGLTGAMISQLPCMDTSGCVETGVSTDSSTIYLTQGCYRLAIETNEMQTYSINQGITGTRGPRPTTHDVIQDMIEMFEMKPLIVKIESFSQGTYFAKMAVNLNNRVLDMDIRPSDAVAIAVRTKTPVYVNQTLLEEYGEYVC